MSLTPNSTSSDSVTSWSSQDSQHESRDFSVLRMLNELGVVPSQERGSSIFAVQENGKYKTAQGCNLAGDEVITRSFLRGRSQWIDEPIITSWREPSIGILEKLKVADQLFNEWSRIQPKPFDPFFDRLWLETASTLRDAGLPWHNNNLNMPEEVDTR